MKGIPIFQSILTVIITFSCAVPTPVEFEELFTHKLGATVTKNIWGQNVKGLTVTKEEFHVPRVAHVDDYYQALVQMGQLNREQELEFRNLWGTFQPSAPMHHLRNQDGVIPSLSPYVPTSAIQELGNGGSGGRVLGRNGRLSPNALELLKSKINFHVKATDNLIAAQQELDAIRHAANAKEQQLRELEKGGFFQNMKERSRIRREIKELVDRYNNLQNGKVDINTHVPFMVSRIGMLSKDIQREAEAIFSMIKERPVAQVVSTGSAEPDLPIAFAERIQ